MSTKAAILSPRNDPFPSGVQIANVQKGHGYNSSSDEEPFDLYNVVPRKNRQLGSRTRLTEIAKALEASRPQSPGPIAPRVVQFSKRLSSESIAATHAIVGLIRQAELRVLAKTVRAWMLRPIRLRTEAFSTRIRKLEGDLKKAKAAAQLVGIISRSKSLRGRNEVFFRLKLMGETTESDAEWESAAEHIQKLRDLLASNIITNVVDKWELRMIALTFFEFKRLPELIS